MRLAASLFIAAFVAVGSTETFDLGDLKQYNHDTKAKPPQLDGNSIWISGLDGDGYDVAFSLGIQSQVRRTLDGCGKSADNCFGKVKDVIRTASVDVDNQLDSRARAQLVSRFAGVLGAIAALIASFIAVQHRLDHAYDGHVVHLPQVKISEATKLEKPTNVVLSAQGSAVITISPTPNPTKMQGSQTPSITPVTGAHNDFAKGDLDIVLDKGLASRIDEIMHRASLNCEDGIKFDKENRGNHKRAGPSYGSAICAAEAAAFNANRGGALNDLLYLGTGDLAFSFRDAAGAANRAAQVVNTFIQTFAPQVNISPELAEQLANVLLALAIDTITNKKALGHDNRIDGSLITTSSRGAPTATGCPDPKKTPLLCGQSKAKNDCDLRTSKPPAAKSFCASGKYKDCACLAPMIVFRTPVTKDDLQVLLKLSTKEPNPVCKITDLSDIPSNVFSSEKNNVYHHFCDKWNKDYKSSMRVDAAGNNKDPEPHFKSVIYARTPPPNPESWKNYDIFLDYALSDVNRFCSVDCKEAFQALETGCSNAGGKDIPIAVTGKIDAGCGIFSYKIANTNAVAYDYQKQICNDKNRFGDHNDIHEGDVRSLSEWVCQKYAKRLLSKDDESKFIHEQGWAGKPIVPLEVNIFWKKGCLLEDGTQKVDISNPLAQKDPKPGTCQDFLLNNYKKCNNGGVGGGTQVGCLVYQFQLATGDR